MAEIGSRASAVEFQGVSKVYPGDVLAVDDVSFRIEPGELVTLLGPSGCGKTTTLRMIAGLEAASSGRIMIGDADVTALPATERDVAMVFQSYALFPHMTVAENVAYGLTMTGLPKDEISNRTAAGLELVGLSGLDERLPSELSGGQQQRVAVARALVLEPQVLLFDEPLSNLDARLRRRVRDEIREIQQKLGLTVVYVTHDQEEALAVSDRIIVMNRAIIAQIGTPRELYEEPETVFVADFIGEANLIPCDVIFVEDDLATVRVGDAELRLAARGAGIGPARLAARPGRLKLDLDQGPSTMKGLITKSVYVGRHIEYSVETESGSIFVSSSKVSDPVGVGTEVHLDLGSTGTILLRI
ncbi:MAG: ABC transporter ATP-binding protein [Pseudomonadota bacterium]